MADFQPNRAGIREYLLSGDLYPALEAHAEPIKARAEALARAHYRTGDYERAFHVERSRARDRVRVRVVNDDEVAPILEARYHILGRAVA